MKIPKEYLKFFLIDIPKETYDTIITIKKIWDKIIDFLTEIYEYLLEKQESIKIWLDQKINKKKYDEYFSILLEEKLKNNPDEKIKKLLKAQKIGKNLTGIKNETQKIINIIEEQKNSGDNLGALTNLNKTNLNKDQKKKLEEKIKKNMKKYEKEIVGIFDDVKNMIKEINSSIQTIQDDKDFYLTRLIYKKDKSKNKSVLEIFYNIKNNKKYKKAKNLQSALLELFKKSKEILFLIDKINEENLLNFQSMIIELTKVLVKEINNLDQSKEIYQNYTKILNDIFNYLKDPYFKFYALFEAGKESKNLKTEYLSKAIENLFTVKSIPNDTFEGFKNSCINLTTYVMELNDENLTNLLIKNSEEEKEHFANMKIIKYFILIEIGKIFFEKKEFQEAGGILNKIKISEEKLNFSTYENIEIIKSYYLQKIKKFMKKLDKNKL